MKTLEECISLYEKKTGEAFQNKEGFRLFFLPERGFCQMRIDGELLMLSQLCGDGHFWVDHSRLLASVVGCKAIGTFAVRKNIEAFIRLWGYRVYRTEELPDGLKRYFGIHKDGTKGQVSPYGKRADGSVVYMVTREVKQT